MELLAVEQSTFSQGAIALLRLYCIFTLPSYQKKMQLHLFTKFSLASSLLQNSRKPRSVQAQDKSSFGIWQIILRLKIKSQHKSTHRHTKKKTKQVCTKGLCPNKVSLHNHLNLHRNYLLFTFNVRWIWLMDNSVPSNETIAHKKWKKFNSKYNLQRCINETEQQGDSLG